MPEYKAPLRDMRFVLLEVLEAEEHYGTLPGAEELNAEMIEAILSEAAKFAENVLAPLNRTGDEEGCTWSEEGVTAPKGFKDAYKQYCDNGFNNLASETEFGGQGLPPSLGIAISEMVDAANTSFSTYPGLTVGAMEAITAHATDEIKNRYLPKLSSGIWSGTMCLTESHCGTDLGMLRTKAVPNGDGTYNITGEKIFITGGDHEMSDNIIHLVLARLPGAPEGTKGISLFVVPKFLPTEANEVGEANAVKCASLEHKMGIKASATCVITFEDSKGWLVGEENKGLRCMFTMMNAARIGTAMQGLSQGEASFQGALTYARERLQMRALTGPKFPDKPADPIIVHPDVRRMLLTQKALTEAARCMAYYCSMLADTSRLRPDTDEAAEAEALLGLLTPICKGFITDTGFESTDLGVQVFGGHGYIREWGMEQLMRDARILRLYEGANGIQALDFIGRKVLANGGAVLKTFTNKLDEFCAEHDGHEVLGPMMAAMKKHTVEWNELSKELLDVAIKNPDEAGAASYDFLSYSGYVCFGYFFARMAVVAQQKLDAGATGADADFYRAKIFTARFYFKRLLTRTRGLVDSMSAGSDSLMDLDEAHFAF